MFLRIDTILKEIYNYCGPLSNSRLLANISFDELKILWRNPMKSFGYSLGHYLTGFINSRGVHESSKDYCHFGHCASEIFFGFNFICLTQDHWRLSVQTRKPVVNCLRTKYQRIKKMTELSTSNVLIALKFSLRVMVSLFIWKRFII